MIVKNTNIVLLFATLTLLWACCTLSVNNVQTTGSAQDTLDSAPTNDIKPTTSVTLPSGVK